MFLPEGDNEPNKVISPFSLCKELVKVIEPVGIAFERIVKEVYGDEIAEENENEEEDQDKIIEEDTTEYDWEKEYKENESKKVVKDLFSNGYNFYKILGLEDKFLNSKDDDFRKAYKKMALIYHPDKNRDNKGLPGVSEDQIREEVKKDIEKEIELKEKNENENDDKKEDKEDKAKKSEEEEQKERIINKKWLKLKEAYETLSDPEKRKKYDSTYVFDDTIPDDIEYTTKNFFVTFGPVFLKNSIWSKKKPVPKIGDMNTPLDKVRKFYKFWSNFQSWRDFSVEGEYDLEEATSRFEKRQMLKENRKMKAALLKEEKMRIDSLTNIAYKRDPRIIEEEKRIQKEKEEEKRQRAILKQKQKEEEELRRQMLIKKHEEEKERKKEMLMKEKEELSNKILNLIKENEIKINNDDIFQFNINSKNDSLKEFLEQIEKVDKKDIKKEIIEKCKNIFGMKFKDEKNEENEKKESIWTKEEMFLLQKGVKKYPAGTKQRWDKIKEIVKTKSEEEIIQMTHYLKVNPNIKIEGDINLKELLKKERSGNTDTKEDKKEENKIEKKTSEINWTAEEQKLLEEALKKYPSSLPANERWTNIAKHVGKTKRQCVDRYKYLASLIKKNKEKK